MFDDVKTFFWYIRRPSLYPALLDLILRAFFLKKHDTNNARLEATEWCKNKAISKKELFNKIGLKGEVSFEDAAGQNYLSQTKDKIRKSKANFGGGGDLDLLFSICYEKEIYNVIETGVAYGWSTSAILHAISPKDGNLISVDMPMPKQEDYHLVGVAIKKQHKKNWKIIRRPDKPGLLKAIKQINKPIDLIHYDSDKSYYGRKWAYSIIMNNLAQKGFFISDDIQDNLYFRDFVEGSSYSYWVTFVEGKYVGIIQNS